MKKSILSLAIATVLLLLASCSEKKVRVTQLLFNETVTNAYLDGEKYTGEAWSDDGKTVCVAFDNGAITSVNVFHTNGTVAVSGKSLSGKAQYFDEEGNEISVDDLIMNYPDIIQRLNKMVENMYCSEELE